MMKLSTFERLLDRHGPDLAQWPDRDVAEGRALLARSPEARQAQALSLRIDTLIASSRPVIDPASAHRAVARALNEIRMAPEPRRLSLGVFWGGLVPRIGMPVPRLAFAVVATAVGFAIGIMLGTPAAHEALHPSGLPVIASADDVLF